MVNENGGNLQAEETEKIETTENVETTEKIETTESNAEDVAPTPDAPVEEQPATETKTFTQEELNAIIGERLERSNKKILEKYGVSSFEELDAKIEKANGYDDLAKSKADVDALYNELVKQHAYAVNNINSERINDIEAILGSKGLQINDENLKAEIVNHPEWVKQVKKITKLSVEKDNNDNKPNEKELVNKYFGVNF